LPEETINYKSGENKIHSIELECNFSKHSLILGSLKLQIIIFPLGSPEARNYSLFDRARLVGYYEFPSKIIDSFILKVSGD
jgi:hypothetical protein